MPLDDRVKSALERSTTVVDPDVRRDLATVRRRTRQLVVRQRIGGGMLAVALLAAAVFLGPRILDVIGSQRGRPADRPTPPSPLALVGSFRVDLSGAGEPLLSEDLDGAWTMEFGDDGTVVWNAPPGSGISEGLPRDTFQHSGSTIVTTAFASELCGGGVGTYTWTRAGSSITFEVVADTCEVRQAILTLEPWMAE